MHQSCYHPVSQGHISQSSLQTNISTFNIILYIYIILSPSIIFLTNLYFLSSINITFLIYVYIIKNIKLSHFLQSFHYFVTKCHIYPLSFLLIMTNNHIYMLSPTITLLTHHYIMLSCHVTFLTDPQNYNLFSVPSHLLARLRSNTELRSWYLSAFYLTLKICSL